jgi:hypothetical protein
MAFMHASIARLAAGLPVLVDPNVIQTSRNQPQDRSEFARRKKREPKNGLDKKRRG